MRTLLPLAVAAGGLLLPGCTKAPPANVINVDQGAPPSDMQQIRESLEKAGIKDKPGAVTDMGDHWLVMLQSPPVQSVDGDVAPALQPARQVRVDKGTGAVSDGFGGPISK